MRELLSHDPYIHAVVVALTAAGLEPSMYWTSDAESNRYDETGVTDQLDAVLQWDGSHPSVLGIHEDGIALIWEHPADRWQWAPRKAGGELKNVPERLSGLPLWVGPETVTAAVRALIVGKAASFESAPSWPGHVGAQAAVLAWEAREGRDSR